MDQVRLRFLMRGLGTRSGLGGRLRDCCMMAMSRY